MKRISVYVIAKNEAKRIRRTLEAVRPVADEIVVVDSGSTDDTVRIASEIADKVVFREWTTYSDQKHYAQELCTNDWVMMDDADEVAMQFRIRNIPTLLFFKNGELAERLVGAVSKQQITSILDSLMQ